MGIQRYSDDGEPQGTAGIPILEVMKKSNITDCAVVVTRYFGGVLLGTGGLTRAYTKGASIALKAGGVVEKVQGVKVSLTLDYDMMSGISSQEIADNIIKYYHKIIEKRFFII